MVAWPCGWDNVSFSPGLCQHIKLYYIVKICLLKYWTLVKPFLPTKLEVKTLRKVQEHCHVDLETGAQKSLDILKFVCDQLAKSHEILMFVCLQKDAKQCCDAMKLDYTQCANR